MSPFNVQANIFQANTLPSGFYKQSDIFAESKEKIFAKSWHYVADAEQVAAPGDVFPFTLLPGVLDEPLVLVRDRNGTLRCLSNVCTHRAKVIVEKSGNHRMLTCGYHGRCFGLDGSFQRMPEFGNAENFPTPADDLANLPVREWMGLVFVAIDPAVDFEEATRPIRERTSWMPLDTLEFQTEGTQDFTVEANWALYCDNYLEGFHIPFVHPALNQAIDFGQYSYEIFPNCNLQLGVANHGEPHFDIPAGQHDFGKKIYAYYFWLFPNLMFNFYPWGLSLNIVEPLGHDRTRVHFRTYRFQGAAFDRTVNNLEKTEMEDEAVVESVQLGMRSRFYKKGRFSPTMERGVHHFHCLICQWMGW